MEKIIDVNSVEKTVDELEVLELPVDELAGNYRYRLVNKFKELIFYYWDNSESHDEVVELMKEAIKVMDASDEEILKMYFEDAEDNHDDIEDGDYANQLFEEATEPLNIYGKS